MKDYKVSVVIPLYNQEKNILKCIVSLKKQTIGFKNIQIILINDGSNDYSGRICERLSHEFFNVAYFEQENQGVSSARNLGIKYATGKYIFYLDADDCLEKHTLKEVSSFFDTVYNEVDLVTYPIETIYRGKKIASHFRYMYLKESGLYDLNENAYIGQTTMNIAVKNLFKNNYMFDENQTFSEDQKYCCDVLADKLKMGFCKNGKYIYYRNDNSSSGKLAGACYIFEQCISFFEELFKKYKKVPIAFQGLYINDIYWKLINNILFPYYYDKINYRIAVERMTNLLKKCDNRVILEHPRIDFFEKYYLLRWKGADSLTCELTDNIFGLKNRDTRVVEESSMEIVITKFKIQGNTVEILGFIKSVFLQFYDGEITLCAIQDEEKIVRKLELSDSAHCYYLSREKTQKFKTFCYKTKLFNTHKVSFEIGFGNKWFPTHFYFMPQVSISHKYRRYKVALGGYRVALTEKNEICFQKNNERRKERIWLYYDCVGIEKDNGYLQFVHDIEKQDDVSRFYIITDKRQKQEMKYMKYYVEFGSRKHKQLLEKCEKVFTAFIEHSNIFPYDINTFERKADKFNFQVVYLQHGVLHIIMPWKYSPEKIMADKIVVSTQQEKKLLLHNGFHNEDLICSGMARFEVLDRNRKKQKKILYAPSWREYLVGNYEKHRWLPLDEKFIKSTYYIKIQKFLESERLKKILSASQYSLDIKLHPIFSMYKDYFKIDNEYINFIEKVENEEEYSLFITDFSSFMYDFIYLHIPVINFIPDIIEFKSGMNGYRTLNYSSEFWKRVACDEDEIVEKIESYLIDGKEYRNEIKVDFFSMSNCRERLYEEMIEEG